MIQVDTTTGVTQGGATTTVTMAYLERAGIASKSDVGNYAYGNVFAECASGFAGFNALTMVYGGPKGFASYCYDLNGNMVSGDGRSVTYAAFDKPTQIVKGTSSVTFAYGLDRKRYKRIDSTSAGITTTIYAADKSFERNTLVCPPPAGPQRRHLGKTLHRRFRLSHRQLQRRWHSHDAGAHDQLPAPRSSGVFFAAVDSRAR